MSFPTEQDNSTETLVLGEDEEDVIKVMFNELGGNTTEDEEPELMTVENLGNILLTPPILTVQESNTTATNETDVIGYNTTDAVNYTTIENSTLSPSPTPTEEDVDSLSPSPTPTEEGFDSLSPSSTPTEEGFDSLSPSPTPTEEDFDTPSPSPTPEIDTLSPTKKPSTTYHIMPAHNDDKHQTVPTHSAGPQPPTHTESSPTTHSAGPQPPQDSPMSLDNFPVIPVGVLLVAVLIVLLSITIKKRRERYNRYQFSDMENDLALSVDNAGVVDNPPVVGRKRRGKGKSNTTLGYEQSSGAGGKGGAWAYRAPVVDEDGFNNEATFA